MYDGITVEDEPEENSKTEDSEMSGVSSHTEDSSFDFIEADVEG